LTVPGVIPVSVVAVVAVDAVIPSNATIASATVMSLRIENSFV
jgi:hypothetical protein